MLGFEIFIYRRVGAAASDDHPPGSEAQIARWMTSLGGLDWLDALVSKGAAQDLGGSGYPLRYTARAGAVLGLLAAGVPKHDGPLVIGDDYVLPGGWIGKINFDRDLAAQCHPDETLDIEAWDQS